MKLEILILTYNCQQTLPATLNSLTQQDYSDFLVTLVDDGSTQNIEAIYKTYKSILNIRFIHYDKNVGCALNRGRALQLIEGKYFFFLDSDDQIRPNCLKELLTFMEENKLDALHSPQLFIQPDDQWSIINRLSNSGGKIFKSDLIKKYKIDMDKRVRWAEDGYMNYICFELASNIGFMQNPFYMYFENLSSVSHSSNFLAEEWIDSFKSFYYALTFVLKYKSLKELRFAKESYKNMQLRYAQGKEKISDKNQKEAEKFLKLLSNILK